MFLHSYNKYNLKLGLAAPRRVEMDMEWTGPARGGGGGGKF